MAFFKKISVFFILLCIAQPMLSMNKNSKNLKKIPKKIYSKYTKGKVLAAVGVFGTTCFGVNYLVSQKQGKLQNTSHGLLLKQNTLLSRFLNHYRNDDSNAPHWNELATEEKNVLIEQYIQEEIPSLPETDNPEYLFGDSDFSIIRSYQPKSAQVFFDFPNIKIKCEAALVNFKKTGDARFLLKPMVKNECALYMQADLWSMRYVYHALRNFGIEAPESTTGYIGDSVLNM